MPLTKIALVGKGRSGKGESAQWLARNTSLRYWGSTSKVICPVAARRLGLSEDEAYRRRHEDRELWRAIGDELRAHDPAHLARITLQHGDISDGIRARIEIQAVRRERLVDLILWIDRDVPEDPTLEFGPEEADVVVCNHWGLPELHERLRVLSRSWGVLGTEPPTRANVAVWERRVRRFAEPP